MAGSAACLGCACMLLQPLLGGAVRLKGAALPTSPGSVSLGRLGEAAETDRPFDCEATPELCQPPFNCHLPARKKPMVKTVWGEKKPVIATADGHADWHTYCSWPQTAKQALQCYHGDLRGYSRTLAANQDALPNSSQVKDSHYCFASGHCDNMDLRPNTTLAEAEAMCDRQFGRKGWTKFVELELSPLDVRFSEVGEHLSNRGELEFAKMACAMGNYHCDALYCQENYCSNPKWRSLWDEDRPVELRDIHGSHYPPEH